MSISISNLVIYSSALLFLIDASSAQLESKPSSINSYQTPRLMRLVDMCMKRQVSEARRLMQLSGTNSDISSLMRGDAKRIIRICSIGDWKKCIRVIKVDSSDSVLMTKYDLRDGATETTIPKKDILNALTMIDGLLVQPITFLRKETHQSSNGVDYVIESLEKDIYLWAIRPIDLSEEEDYKAVIKMIDVILDIENRAH